MLCVELPRRVEHWIDATHLRAVDDSLDLVTGQFLGDLAVGIQAPILDRKLLLPRDLRLNLQLPPDSLLLWAAQLLGANMRARSAFPIEQEDNGALVDERTLNHAALSYQLKVFASGSEVTLEQHEDHAGSLNALARVRDLSGAGRVVAG